MRHLQEKYVGVESNTFSKAQFKRDAIMECPNLVTHFNSYEEVVSILKNKSILQEIKDVEYSTSKPEDYLSPDVLDTAIRCELDDKFGTLDVSSEDYDKAKKEAIKNLTKDQLYYVNKYGEQEETPGEQMEKVKLNEEAAGSDYDKMMSDLGDAVAAEEGLESASADELKIYAQIATRLGDDVDVVNAFEYLESLPNYKPEFTPGNLRKANEDSLSTALGNAINVLKESRNEAIQNIESDEKTKERISGMLTTFVSDDEEDTQRLEYAQFVNSEMEDPTNIVDYKEIMSMDDLTASYDNYLENHSEDISDIEESINEQDSNVVRLAQMIADEFTIEDSEGDRFSTYVLYKIGKVENDTFELDTEATEKTPEEAAKYGTGEGWGGSFRVSPIEGGYEVRNTEKGGLVATEIDGNFRMLDAQESRAELETDFMQSRKETSDYMEEEVDEVGGVDRHGKQVPVATASRFGRRDRTMPKSNDREIKEGYSTEEKRIVQLAVNKIAKYMNVSPEIALQYVIGTAEEMRSQSSPKDLKEVFRKLIKEVIQG